MREQVTDLFDDITDLAEAKRCLKVVYRQSVNIHHGRCVFMGIAAIELLAIIFLLIKD